MFWELGFRQLQVWTIFQLRYIISIPVRKSLDTSKVVKRLSVPWPGSWLEHQPGAWQVGVQSVYLGCGSLPARRALAAGSQSPLPLRCL